ncbi:hypothetical protein QCA50_004087 [Cerrena zonata]|uniref:Uncharacterized protein n=1 Tax=Cerrena zonata TaxID=2478898 RepID=A0AAW0GKI8_9APHY
MLLLVTPFAAALPMNSPTPTTTQTYQDTAVPPSKDGLNLQSRMDLSQMSPAEVERLHTFSSGLGKVGLHSPMESALASAQAAAVQAAAEAAASRASMR